MQSSFRAVSVAFALALSIAYATPIAAQTPAKPGPSKIDIKYEPVAETRKAQLQPVIDLLRQKQVLERLQQFLSPLKLKRNLVVRTADCGDSVYYRPYTPDQPVTICYQLVQLIEDLAPEEGYIGLVGPMRVSADAVRVGPFVQEVLHNVALAIFHIQGIPVWGGAAFAADNVAAFLMLQFGTDVAMKTILGTAYFLNQRDNLLRGYGYAYLADVRPTMLQRYYSTICVAYGSDSIKFGMFVADNRRSLSTDLSDDIAARCQQSYPILQRAFRNMILEPHVDPDLQKQVLATKWLD